MGGQTAIPCTLMRGGTSKGPYFQAHDLPADIETRDKVLLSVMGSPDLRQIDGIGGGDPLTSKVAIVGPSERPGTDVNYLFAQVVVGEARVDTSPNCGNMLAGVGPFAIERGLVKANGDETEVSIHMVNSASDVVATVQTPGGVVTHDGDARIDGAPGTSAPIMLNFRDIAGSTCGALLPTGNVVDEVNGVPVTCIDNGMPVVVLRAADVGRTGYEDCNTLDADTELKEIVEAIRLEIGPAMNLGDVRDKVVPKMSLVAPPRARGAICSRTFIPHRCHAAIGVLGAISVATACMISGSVAQGLAKTGSGAVRRLSVEHPSGEFTVELEMADGDGPVPAFARTSLLRTARKLFDGHVYVPATLWEGRQ